MQKRRGRKPGKKATVRNECLARLKNGATPPELLREFSPGPVYDAVRVYLTFVEGEVGEMRRSREKEQQELARLKEESRVASGEVAVRKTEAETFTRRVRELEEDIKDQGIKVSGLRLSEEYLEKKLGEYTGRGITDRTFGRLDRFNFGSEGELISRLDTAEKYQGFVSETEKKGSELRDLTENVKGLSHEKSDLEEKITGLRGKMDEEFSKNYVQSESLRILSTFYDDGYKSKDIEGIRLGLNKLGIAGDPKTSVRRLVDFLGGELELSKLGSEIMARQDELLVLRNTIEGLKGQLRSYNDVALATLTEAEAISKAKIEGVYTDVIGKIKVVGEIAEKQINTVSSSQLAAIYSAGKAGIGNLIDVHNQAKFEIEETVNTVRDEVRTTIRSEFEPYHGSFKLLPQMQPFVEYGFFLMKVSMDRTSAERVPAIFVSLMASSIDAWVKAKLPFAITKVPEEIEEITPLFKIELPCKLSAVSAWLSRELAYVAIHS